MIDFQPYFQARKTYVTANNLEAYRLYDREDPALAAAIDIVADNAVIHVFEPEAADHLSEIEAGVRALTGARDFFYKDRTKASLTLPTHAPKKIVIKEYGHDFLINLSDYLDTGLFLDHRETRRWIAGLAHGKKVLNTFAYTGSFTVYAAAGGATETHSVDLSKTYSEWMRENWKLNGMDAEQHRIYTMDAFDYFRYALKKGFWFDIIIVDPPTFSRGKSGSFSVQKDHAALLSAAGELLAPGGFILFSTNCSDFHFHRQSLAGLNGQLKNNTVPSDFRGPLPHTCFTLKKRGR